MTSAKHIASIGLLLVSFALIGIGFGGSTDPKLAWGLSKLETKGNFGYVGSFDCKTQYHWGLTEYKKTADGCEFFGSDYAALSDAYTDDYDSDKCKDLESLWGKDFCKNCEKTGKSIVSLLSIAFISAAIGVLMIFMRMSGGGWVRTAVTALALMSSMVLLLICWGIWQGSCQSKINESGKNFVDNISDILGKFTTKLTTELTTSVYIGFAVTFVAWVLVTISICIQCCTGDRENDAVMYRRLTNRA